MTGLEAPERALRDAVRQVARQPAGWTALALHLSRLPPPGPRPHHRRVAQTLLAEAASRHEGELFVPANGDLVLLCRRQGRADGLDPAALPPLLLRLLQPDLADPADAVQLVSLWPLPAGLEALRCYAAGLQEAADPPEAPPDPADAVGALLHGPGLATLVQQQMGAILPPGSGASPGRLRPLYREFGFAIAALEARAGLVGQLAADPALFRHLLGRLDAPMLAALGRALGDGSALDAARPDVPPLHLNLTLPTLLAGHAIPLLRRLAETGRSCGLEVSLTEACANPTGFAAARDLAASLGATLALDGIAHTAMLLARPWALGADLIKLDWSARLGTLAGPDAGAMEAAIAEAGPERMVLQRADTEAAIRWGLARGIRRFQGRHVDAILAASRHIACPLASGCALGQCIERGGATSAAGRHGCGNPDLLASGSATPGRVLEPA